MNFGEKKTRQHNKQKPPNVFQLPFIVLLNYNILLLNYHLLLLKCEWHKIRKYNQNSYFIIY